MYPVFFDFLLSRFLSFPSHFFFYLSYSFLKYSLTYSFLSTIFHISSSLYFSSLTLTRLPSFFSSCSFLQDSLTHSLLFTLLYIEFSFVFFPHTFSPSLLTPSSFLLFLSFFLSLLSHTLTLSDPKTTSIFFHSLTLFPLLPSLSLSSLSSSLTSSLYSPTLPYLH